MIKWLGILSFLAVCSWAPAQSLDFQYTTSEGTSFTDSSLIGKVTIVEFWMPWCAPCRKANKKLNTYIQQLDSNQKAHVQVVCIALESDSANWHKAIEFDALEPYKNILDTAGKSSEVWKASGGSGMPYSLVFNQEGQLVHSGLRGKILFEYVTKLLN